MISGADHFGKISVETAKRATTETIMEDMSARISFESDEAILNENSF